jgi:penicillin V acylase-like amidase (Ntn superfamily)
MKTFAGLLTIILVYSGATYACDAFLLSNSESAVVGKNFDMQSGNGLIIVNKRNLAKKAMSQGNPQTWTSKYGSVTFNWVSRELPQGGINEKGLVVEVLMLPSAQLPNPAGSKLPTINELQWAQYQLDNYSTVAEVQAHVNDLLIEQVAAPVHYFVCDATKACLVVDPIRGQYVVNTASALPYKALTNSTYSDSSTFAAPYLNNQVCPSVPDDYNSLDRFARVACSIANSSIQDSGSAAFETLRGVQGVLGQGGAVTGDQTQWSIVYDVIHKSVSLKTSASPSVKTFALKSFDFSCSEATQVLDVNDTDSGDVSEKFSDYTNQIDQANLVLTQAAFPQLPSQMIPAIVAAAGSSTCQEP